jgi:hypothetical protein
MTDELTRRVEVLSMSAQGARVIDIAEYRRRREAKSASIPAVAPAMVWVPVWMWVPLWPVR